MDVSTLVLIVLLCGPTGSYGSDISFTSTKSSIQAPLTHDMRMRCSIKDNTGSSVIGKRDVTHTNNDLKYVTSMVVSLDGADIASLSEHIAAQYTGSSNNVKVNGQVSNTSPEPAYIELTWKYPVTNDTGKYRCEVTGVDSSGHGVILSSTLEVIDEEIRLNDLISEINALQLAKDRDEEKIQQLEQTLSTHIYFTAIMKTQKAIGNRLVYDAILSNIGGSYDTTSGLFTAPMSGHYQFTVTMVNTDNSEVDGSIMHNNVAIATVDTDTQMHTQSGTMSVNLHLSKGDTVWVNTIRPVSQYLTGLFNIFSGNLMYPD